MSFDKCSFVSIARFTKLLGMRKKAVVCQGPFSFLRIYVIGRGEKRGKEKNVLFLTRDRSALSWDRPWFACTRIGHGEREPWVLFFCPLGVRCKDFDLTRLDGKIFNRIIINWIEQASLSLLLFFFYFCILSKSLHDFVILKRD